MRVTHLSLHDFRNYHRAEVSFLPGPNLVIGRNGQGKTNLVEAIAYFATLGSHRVSGDSALIRAGEQSGIARVRVSVGERDVLLEAQLNRGRPNRAQVNRNAVRPRELPRWLSCVVFAPEDLTLVRGEPGVRRRFLDDAVIARNPAFAGTIADYERVVRQRTTLLKSARHNGRSSALEQTLAVWNSQLVSLGTDIMLARRSLIAALTEPVRSGYASIVNHDHDPRIMLHESVTSAGESANVSRETVWPAGEGQAEGQTDKDVSRETMEEEFEQALRAVHQQELDRGVTLVGPHRDDALFSLNGLPVKGYASHGESWSFVLALRLGVADLLRAESITGDPVIILDDVFAELDARRRAALMTAVEKFEQVIVTAAVQEDVPSGQWHQIHVESGVVTDQGVRHAGG